MIEGRYITQVTKVWMRRLDGQPFSIMIEKKHKVIHFRKYLLPGPVPGGLYRKKALIQFTADPGGIRTVNAEDIVL